MPRVIIQYDPQFGVYSVIIPQSKEAEENINKEYEVLVDMKASSFKSIRRAEERWVNNQEFLEKFFISAQTSGRHLREQ